MEEAAFASCLMGASCVDTAPVAVPAPAPLPGVYGGELPTGYGDEIPVGYGFELPTGYGDEIPVGYGDELSAGFELPTGYGGELPTGYGDELPAGYGGELPAGYGTAAAVDDLMTIDEMGADGVPSAYPCLPSLHTEPLVCCGTVSDRVAPSKVACLR